MDRNTTRIFLADPTIRDQYFNYELSSSLTSTDVGEPINIFCDGHVQRRPDMASGQGEFIR